MISSDRWRQLAATGSPARGTDSGMVTLETALVLPLVVLLVAAAAWLLALGQMQARLTDAARATARELARGTAPEVATQAGRAVVADADIDVLDQSTVVVVRARRVVRGPGPLLGTLQRHLEAEVVTAVEEPLP